MELSDVQLKILTKFVDAVALRYTDGRPEGVDNDLYKYHLKFLIQRQLIEKQGDLYCLTEKGKILGRRFELMQEKFFVCVLDLVFMTKDGVRMALLQERTKHPNFGEISVVTGKLKPGEAIIEAADRKLKEEAGLSAKFTRVGMLRAIRYNTKRQLVFDQWFNVCTAEVKEISKLRDTKFGKNFFHDVSKVEKDIAKSHSMSNFVTMIEKLDAGDVPFFIEDRQIVPAF